MLRVIEAITLPENLRDDRNGVDAPVDLGLKAIVRALAGRQTCFYVFTELL
jgi:hypothetical protein